MITTLLRSKKKYLIKIHKPEYVEPSIPKQTTDQM